MKSRGKNLLAKKKKKKKEFSRIHPLTIYFLHSHHPKVLLARGKIIQ